METNGIVTTAYGQNDLSDKKVKQNIRDADLEELQAIFDRAKPKRYDRADFVCWVSAASRYSRLGDVLLCVVFRLHPGGCKKGR